MGTTASSIAAVGSPPGTASKSQLLPSTQCSLGMADGVCTDQVLDLLQRPRPHEVDALQRLPRSHQVEVRVDDTGKNQVAPAGRLLRRPRLGVDHTRPSPSPRGRRSLRLYFLEAASHQESAPVHSERWRPRPIWVSGEGLGVVVDDGGLRRQVRSQVHPAAPNGCGSTSPGRFVVHPLASKPWLPPGR